MISVIVPTCHRNDLLAKCLDCLAPGRQTLPPEWYEVIVTDDGSRTTAEAMLAERYPWAQWAVGPRKGPAANRNSGAALAKGEWLAFTDDDCLPKPGWLEAYYSAIEEGVFVYEGKTTCEAGLRSPLEHAPVNLTGGWLWSCNMLVKKTVFDQMNGFDEKFPHPHMEDTDIRERIKQEVNSFPFVPNAVVDHPPRRTPAGKTLAQTHESEYYYWNKIGERTCSSRRLLINLLKARVRTINSYRFSRDTLIAIVSLLVELTYTVKCMRRWEQKYCLAHSDTSLMGSK